MSAAQLKLEQVNRLTKFQSRRRIWVDGTPGRSWCDPDRLGSSPDTARYALAPRLAGAEEKEGRKSRSPLLRLHGFLLGKARVSWTYPEDRKSVV